MSRVTLVGRSVRTIPTEVAGDFISAIWSTQTQGSYLSKGGHLGLCNRSDTDMFVWVGAIPVFEFTGSVGTFASPSLSDVVDLTDGVQYTHDDTGRTGWQDLVQDPYGRYIVQEADFVQKLYYDGPLWTAGQLTYARAFIRKFGIVVPAGSYYEPLIAPTSTVYFVSVDDATRQVANLLT